MSCPFYWYNHHYACRKTGQDVNEDTYYTAATTITTTAPSTRAATPAAAS